jgi:hypothetical protein
VLLVCASRFGASQAQQVIFKCSIQLSPQLHPQIADAAGTLPLASQMQMRQLLFHQCCMQLLPMLAVICKALYSWDCLQLLVV